MKFCMKEREKQVETRSHNHDKRFLAVLQGLQSMHSVVHELHTLCYVDHDNRVRQGLHRYDALSLSQQTTEARILPRLLHSMLMVNLEEDTQCVDFMELLSSPPC